MFGRLLICLICLILCSSLSIQQEINPESDFIITNYFQINERLVNDLFRNYSKILPGVYMAERNHLNARPISANMTLAYCSLLSIVGYVLAYLEYQTTWTDPRLKWNPKDYHGIERFPVTRGSVWMPDIMLFDIFAYSDTMPTDQSIEVYYDGTVSLYRSTVLEFICLLDLKPFPFDTQECFLYAYSYYPGSALHLLGAIADEPMGSKGYSGNGEWTVVNITVEADRYVNKPDYRLYEIVIYTFTIKRSTTYYVVLIIVPSLILALLCVVGLFWKRINADSYINNLGLGFAAILALMFVLQTVTQDMPKMNVTDRLSVYLLVSLILLTCATIVAMLIGELVNTVVPEPAYDKWTKHLLRLLLNRLNIVAMVIFCLSIVVNFAILFCWEK